MLSTAFTHLTEPQITTAFQIESHFRLHENFPMNATPIDLKLYPFVCEPVLCHPTPSNINPSSAIRNLEQIHVYWKLERGRDTKHILYSNGKAFVREVVVVWFVI